MYISITVRDPMIKRGMVEIYIFKLKNKGHKSFDHFMGVMLADFNYETIGIGSQNVLNIL
jgi:hypothetical protein